MFRELRSRSGARGYGEVMERLVIRRREAEEAEEGWGKMSEGTEREPYLVGLT